jgi:hypothetical protein
MEQQYSGQCMNCDVETYITVVDEDELPLYCPMCGCQMDFDEDGLIDISSFIEIWSYFFMWYYNDEPYEIALGEYQGFVYCITELTTNKMYIGKKVSGVKRHYHLSKVRHANVGQLSSQTG